MKYILLVIIVLLICSKCKDENNYHSNYLIISGGGTISIYDGNWDGTKIHGHYHGHGRNDTVNKTYFDTTPIHDTVYNWLRKQKIGNDTLIFGSQ